MHHGKIDGGWIMAALGLGAPHVGEWMGEGPTTANRTEGMVADAGGDG